MSLQEAHKRLDDQFAVLSRLSVSALNELNLRVSGADADPISYDIINLMFAEWEKFKTRSDYRDHMRVWVMGGDTESLPPPQENEDTPSEESKDQEVTEFGGDYAENCCSAESSDPAGDSSCEECDEEDSMSEGQDVDSDNCGGAEVPQVPECVPESENLDKPSLAASLDS